MYVIEVLQSCGRYWRVWNPIGGDIAFFNSKRDASEFWDSYSRRHVRKVRTRIVAIG
jgi:hypothetical protein